MKVLIPHDINEAGKTLLKKKGYDVVVGTAHDQETIKREIADADAVIFRTDQFQKDVLEKAKNLKVLARYGVGVDNVDLEYCRENGIFVTIAKKANANAVAERTIGFILACTQKLGVLDRMTKDGFFSVVRNSITISEVSGKTLGIIGLGSIGTLVSGKARFGLDMNVVAYDIHADQKKTPGWVDVKGSIEEVVSVSDVVSIHVPLKDSTRNLFNKDMIAKMKDGAILINCARGGIVDEEALAEALNSGKLAGAAVDVFANEPPEDSNPLFKCDNFICSPHNAALTKEASAKMSLVAAESVDDVLSGRVPKFPVVIPKNPRVKIK